MRFSRECEQVVGSDCYSKTEFMPDGTKDCELLASGWRRAMCKAWANNSCGVHTAVYITRA